MLTELMNRYPQLAPCQDAIVEAARALLSCYTRQHQLLLCGNGGSCCDCDHIVGELMKGFLKKRPLSPAQKEAMLKNCPSLSMEQLDKLQGGLPAIALPGIAGLNSAFCNDVDPELIYAQSVLALGSPGDVFLGISTSGNSKNVAAAAKVAKGLGLTVIGLTGKSGGALKDIADICICVPETETFKVQELHLPVYHYLCAETEAHFFPE